MKTTSVALSNRTIAQIAGCFSGGSGPSHSTIDLVFTAGDADDYLVRVGGNKMDRVLYGLRYLRDGAPATDKGPALLPAPARLLAVAADLATRLIATGDLDADVIEGSFASDGFTLDGTSLQGGRVTDEPADKLAEHVRRVFGERPELAIARRHYEQAARAFNRRDFEAANAQYRSALDATYDALAAGQGCPVAKKGGEARKWLARNGHLEDDESELLRAAAAFAGRAGSHAGLSDAADCQLRRHFVTALITFGLSKLS